MPQYRVWVSLVILLGPAVAGADWPHLRGPAYDGVCPDAGLAEAWPEGGPPRLWERDLGQGHSGFVVADGRLYTQRQTHVGQDLLCLDPATGRTLWEEPYDWAWQPSGAYPGPYASPTVYRGKIYFASPAGVVGCRDARTGAAIWAVNVREKFQGKGAEFGFAATPTVEDGRVYLPVGGPNASLVALDADDGHTVWATGSDPGSYCPVLPITFQGRRCLVGYLQNSFTIVDATTGKVLVRQSLSSGYDEHSAWPLYREPHLLFTGPFRAPASRVELQPGPDGSLLARTQWLSKELANDVASSVLYREHVYGFDIRQLQSSKHRPSRGTFKCVEWATGKTAWSSPRPGHATVLVADGKLYLLSDAGLLTLARADPAAYQELGRVQLFQDEACWTPPTLWRGRLFVRSPSKAVCLWVGRTDEAAAATSATNPPPPRSWRLDPTWLLTRERDYPNDAFTAEELATWFAACVAILAIAAVLAAVGRLVGLHAHGTFLALAFALGLLGPNVLSSAFDRCLFTWPVSLYVAFHATLWAGRAATVAKSPRAGWLARLAIVGFLLVCWGYYELCRSVGMFVAWAFLFGFPAAFVPAWLAVRAAMKSRPLQAGVWTLLAFAAFFWSCPVLLWWKAAHAV